VLHVLKQRGETVTPAVYKFLRAASAKFGAETSVHAVFDSIKTLMINTDDELAANRLEIESLKRKLEESELRVEALETLRDKKTRSDDAGTVVAVAETAAPKADAEVQSVANSMVAIENKVKVQSVADSMVAIEKKAPPPPPPPAPPAEPAERTETQLQFVEHVLGWTFGMAHSPEDHFVLRGTFKDYDVRNVCRKLEEVHATEDGFLKSTTQSWAVGEFKRAPPTSTVAALSTILAHGMSQLREQFDFADGEEWTNPLLLAVAKDDDVDLHMIEDDGATQECDLNALVNVDTQRTAIAFWFEATNAFCFAKKVPDAEAAEENAELSD